MKKIIFLIALFIGVATPLHAKKIGCQFKALQEKINLLGTNAIKTWRAIGSLHRQIKHYEKKSQKNRTYMYQNYQNPYYTNNLMMPAARNDDEDEDEVLIIGGDAAPAA